MSLYDNLVHEEDLFGTKEPWNIWEEYGGDQHYNQELYFLCKVKRLNSMGSHIHRKTDHAGTWIELSEEELVYYICRGKSRSQPCQAKKKVFIRESRLGATRRVVLR
ncbi:hypothetical protein C1H46_009673 [Malus baccata]|uniref:NAC domain-containing protein n=1 Tax=Malus baccata TaxID=106549 RepID=A0A540N2E0_MALBA|nr:hypothetical protein C1H46_009673 [Malus baccata]